MHLGTRDPKVAQTSLNLVSNCIHYFMYSFEIHCGWIIAECLSQFLINKVKSLQNRYCRHKLFWLSFLAKFLLYIIPAFDLSYIIPAFGICEACVLLDWLQIWLEQPSFFLCWIIAITTMVLFFLWLIAKLRE